jgi:hypothetical protein
MNLTLDPNLYTQIGLDSGSLTMLGTIVHNLPEPGEYRGVIYRGTEVQTVFYVKVDKESAAAHVNVDLAKLTEPSSDPQEPGDHFVVNPRGYVVLHVSGGRGGYHVLIAKAEDNPKQKPFDSRELTERDIFAAIIIRPGAYSVTNLLTKARGEVVVRYPTPGKFVYPPPNPVKVECAQGAIEPKRIELQPGQGLVYHPKVPSRIKIELLKPDDGPGRSRVPVRDGWRKPVLIAHTKKPTKSS